MIFMTDEIKWNNMASLTPPEVPVELGFIMVNAEEPEGKQATFSLTFKCATWSQTVVLIPTCES